MRKAVLAVVSVVLLYQCAIGIPPSHAQEPATAQPPPGSVLRELISGYQFRSSETRALQDDDFRNPGMTWVDQGKSLWSEAEGNAGKACSNCHDQTEQTIKAAGVSYPKFFEPWGKLINLEQRINLCRTENMQAPAWAWESDELLAVTAYVRHQSRGQPVEVDISGPARAFYENGKAFFYRRRGLLDMNCAHCHEKYYGKHLRSDWLSQGQTNGFPSYRMPLERLASVHRWFQICNARMRSTPYEFGADEYVNLELFAAWRGNGLPIETPAVR